MPSAKKTTTSKKRKSAANSKAGSATTRAAKSGKSQSRTSKRTTRPRKSAAKTKKTSPNGSKNGGSTRRAAAKKKSSTKTVASNPATAQTSTTITASSVAPESSSFIQRRVTDDGICILTFDAPQSGANVLRESVLRELGDHLSWIEKQDHHNVRALVVDSAKEKIFIAGADIDALYRLTPEKLEELLALGQEVFNRLADISIPTVAAIHGACMGGGLELALSCDYRVASDAKATKLALPETMLGIVPAWGGCTRLPRLIGAHKALPLILTGKKLVGKQARKLGVVDAVCPREYLLNAARHLLQDGKAKRKNHWFANNPAAGALLRALTRPQLLKKTRGNYPAPLKALEVVTRGSSTDRTAALKLERDAVVELAKHPATHNLIRTFFLQQRAKKLKYSPASTDQVRKGAVSASAAPLGAIGSNVTLVGAGVMGSGIAHWLSSRGYRVILQDIGPNQIAAGLGLISKRYAEAVKRRIFTKNEAQRLADNISPAHIPVPLDTVDLVIEAATENLDLKKKIFQDLAARTRENTILATNTSALPIEQLASEIANPERVIGIHFFNPVHRMQLVEIVVSKQTAPEVVQATVDFTKAIGKLPVIVSDSPGFLVNRVLMPYLVEAGRLFERGVSAKAIDNAMLDFGMPMGPLRLLDEIGLDVALDVAQTLAAAFPDRMAVPAVLEKMVGDGYLGKKSGQGFYSYKQGKQGEPNAPLTASTEMSKTDLQSRMALVMVNEAARSLDEGVVAEPEDVDFAMIMGTGFAPFRGGPLRYADSLGAAKLTASLNLFAGESGGEAFAPCSRLTTMAEMDLKFYLPETD